MMTTQRPAVSEHPTLRVVAQAEEVIQFSLSLRKGLRKQLARLADEADMAMRVFVLDALKAKGLDVRLNGRPRSLRKPCAAIAAATPPAVALAGPAHGPEPLEDGRQRPPEAAQVARAALVRTPASLRLIWG